MPGVERLSLSAASCAHSTRFSCIDVGAKDAMGRRLQRSSGVDARIARLARYTSSASRFQVQASTNRRGTDSTTRSNRQRTLRIST